MSEKMKLIRLSKSCIGDAEKNAVMEVLDRKFLGMGEKVKEFEGRLSDYFQRPALCVVNGTAALHLACQSIGLKEGDEVLVPSLTYVASFQAISATGAKPISCDIESESLLIDFNDAENRITERTKAIMVVHYGGRLVDYYKLLEFAKKFNLRVIEDAAHAFGSVYKDGRLVGSVGDIVCFSFDGIKNITSGEGGCVVSSDSSVMEKVSDARLLGVIKDSDARYSGKRSWDFTVKEQGWRYHMSDIMAAIGIAQLDRQKELKEKRQMLVRFYDDLLKGCEVIRTIRNDYRLVVPHIYVVVLNESVDRDIVRNQLEENGVQTGIHYKPNHLLNMYKDTMNQNAPLENLDRLSNQLLTLPLHPDMTSADVEYVCEKLFLSIGYR